MPRRNRTTKPIARPVLYQITNTVNGKFYIGITSKAPQERWGNHRRAAVKGKAVLYRAMRKYGLDNFTFTVLEDFPDWPSAQQAECCAIAARNPDYNCTGGGDGCPGRWATEETRRKQSIAAKLRPPMTAEVRAKIGKASSMRKPSPETRALMSEAAKRLPPRKPETCAKLSAAMVLWHKQNPRKTTPETRAKQSAALKGKPWSPARRRRHELSKTRPQCVTGVDK